MLSILRLMRPQQWVKNIFLFAPLFFSGKFTDLSLFYSTLWACFAFIMASSAMYCLNDILDYPSDRLHPLKCRRPIASGAVKIGTGYVLGVFLTLIAFSTIFFTFDGNQRNALLLLIFAYMVMNIAYSLKLKKIVLLDVFLVAIGFVMRTFAGSFATGIILSEWLVLMTFLLALFLSMAKRRDDVVIFEKTGQKMRSNVNAYNLVFINQSLTIIASVTLVCYILYTLSPEVVQRIQSHYLYLTTVFVLFGMLRYLQITLVDTRSGSPTKVLFHDHFIQICVLGWILSFAIILYA